MHDKDHGKIRRINVDGTGAEIVALSVRNTVGFDWNPVNHQLYFSDNQRDWLSEDSPELVVHLNKNGTVRSTERFLTGFVENNNYIYIGRGRVQQMADGSLLVSDDWNGAVYRISYSKAHTASR